MVYFLYPSFFLACVYLYALIRLLIHSSCLYVRGLRINLSTLLDLIGVKLQVHSIVVYSKVKRRVSSSGIGNLLLTNTKIMLISILSREVTKIFFCNWNLK